MNSKRLISLLLCLMLMCSIGVCASAEDPTAYDIWVGGAQITSETLSTASYTYNPASKILTLTGTINGNPEVQDGAAVYIGSAAEVAEIRGLGNAAIIGAMAPDKNTIALNIASTGEITISGSLTAQSADNTASGKNSIAIFSGAALKVTGTVTAISGNSAGDSYAIQANLGVPDNGEVNATAGAGYKSVAVVGGVTCTGNGKLTATAGSGTYQSCGISAGTSSLPVILGTVGATNESCSISSTGGTAGSGSSGDADSYGISSEVIVNGGTLTALGGEATGVSAGIMANAADITVSGPGKLIATGGNAKDSSYGINCTNLTLATTGSIMAAGGKDTAGSAGGSGKTRGIEATNVTVYSGTLTATSADVDSWTGGSHAIHCVKFTATGGTVNASSKETVLGNSNGICADDQVNISGDTTDVTVYGLSYGIKVQENSKVSISDPLGLEAGANKESAVDADKNTYNYLGTYAQYIHIKKMGTVKKITVSPDDLSNLAVGDTGKINATVTYRTGAADDSRVSFASTDSSVIEIDATGNYTAKTAGETTIIVTSLEDSNVSVSVPVTVAAERPTITVSPESAEVKVGENVQFTASVTGMTATDVVWSTDDSGVVTIDQTGKVTGVKIGKGDIFAKNRDDETIVGMAEVTVKSADVPVTDIYMPAEHTISTLGGTYNLKANVNLYPTNTTSTKDQISWTEDSKGSVVTVKDGIVTAVGNGTAIVTANIDGKAATCKVTVTNNKETRKITPYSGVWYIDGSAASGYTFSVNTTAGVRSVSIAGIPVSADVKKDTSRGISTVTIPYATMKQMSRGYNKQLYVTFDDGSTATARLSVIYVKDSPPTGDSSNVALWSVVCVLSLAAAGSAITTARKKKD